jgi:rhodanese-related sulfurtransferase
MIASVKDMVAEAAAQLGTVIPEEASSELDAGTAVLIDVREPTEWEHHVAGALQVPRGLLEFAADPASPRHLAGLEPSARIIVMCRSGARSALAGATLKNMGFGDVRNLVGGFTAWTAAGLATAEHTADL